ncbi:MAG: alpha/beta fold hydrolase [Actinomycetota bacterium]|nr:alpha/beta fold hydrolase [Actinomycetota bacterium]
MSRQRRLFFAVVAVALAVAGGLAAFAARGPHLRDDGVVPVILVHGYGGDSSMMETLAARLKSEGHEVVAVDLPLRGIGDIEVSAETVADAVEGTRSPEVDVVGFSAGGVVVRAYADSLDEEDRPRTVVTLGSPNHGAEIAASAGSLCTGACEQLALGSPFLADLNEPDETPPGPRFVSIWTQEDRVVTPPESALLDGAVNVRMQDVCPGSDASHLDLVRDPVALALVLRALGGDLDAAPAGECDALRAAGA